MKTGVIDRIENNKVAILLVGDTEEEIIIPFHWLPSGAREGDWVKVYMDQGQVNRVEIDVKQSRMNRERIAAKLAALSHKKRSKYKNVE